MEVRGRKIWQYGNWETSSNKRKIQKTTIPQNFLNEKMSKIGENEERQGQKAGSKSKKQRVGRQKGHKGTLVDNKRGNGMAAEP